MTSVKTPQCFETSLLFSSNEEMVEKFSYQEIGSKIEDLLILTNKEKEKKYSY